MRRVVAAVDNSAAARPVLAAALALAPVLGASVDAVHVSEDGDETARAEAAAQRVPFAAVPGAPIDVLAGVASRPEVVAIVVGRSGSPTARRGHLVLSLADRTDRPVVVVPPDWQRVSRLRRVLVAMEGTAAKPRELQRAIELAAGADLELVVVHVDDARSIPPFTDSPAYETEAFAQEFLARFCPGAPAARLELRLGRADDEILHAAALLRPNLLALGWPRGAGGDRGHVVRAVLDRSPVPVLLVAWRRPGLVAPRAGDVGAPGTVASVG